MSTRLVKQLLYGAGFIVFFALIIFLFYWIFLRATPPPQDPNAIPQNLPLPQVNWIRYFPTNEQTIIALEMQNPNVDYAADTLNYAITLLRENKEVLQTLAATSIIYAGEIKNIVLTANVTTSDIASANIAFQAINWRHKADFREPQTQTRDIKTELGGTNAGPVVSGYITNQEAFPIGKITLIGLLFSASGTNVSASKTEIDSMNAFGERLFTINFPKDVMLALQTPKTPVALFTKDLLLGTRSADILRLQQFLIDQSFLTGEPTDYFGAATKNALIKYQKAVKISPANGLFGPKTRDAVNKELTNQALAAEKDDPNAADPGKTKIYVEAIR